MTNKSLAITIILCLIFLSGTFYFFLGYNRNASFRNNGVESIDSGKQGREFSDSLRNDVDVPAEVTPDIVRTESNSSSVDDFWTTDAIFFKSPGLYINSRYQYSFAYPGGTIVKKESPYMMSIEEGRQGVTIESLIAKYGGDLCTWIKLPLGGVVAISARENFTGNYVHCARTGVGSTDIEYFTDNWNIAGQETIVRGMFIKGEVSQDEVSYVYYYSMPDNTRLYFEWSEKEGVDPEIIQSKQQEVRDVLSSLRF